MRNSFALIALAILITSQRAIAEDSLIALFNGKNLHEWSYHLEKPEVKPASIWSVKDGILRCTGQTPGYIYTKHSDFENYVLTVQWRWPRKGGNNGVLVHITTPNALGVWPKCYEVQLQERQAGELWVIGTTLEVEHPTTHVEDRRHKNLITGAEKPLGEWNTMEVTCLGNEIEVRVNKYLVNRATKLSQQRGAIGLQSEGTPIEFREVSLRKLPPQLFYFRQQERARAAISKQQDRARAAKIQELQRARGLMNKPQP